MANVIKGATDTLTSAGTAEALDATGPTNITSVTIKADDDNTSPIYIGDLNVSSSAARFRGRNLLNGGVTHGSDHYIPLCS